MVLQDNRTEPNVIGDSKVKTILEILVRSVYRGVMRKYGAITRLFVFSLLFVVGCEDEPVKVVKPKPKPSADDWIGTWEVELENGEPYNDSLDDRVRDIVERIVGDEDPLDEFSAEDVSLSTKVLFSNNGTYFVDNKFNFTMVYGISQN